MYFTQSQPHHTVCLSSPCHICKSKVPRCLLCLLNTIHVCILVGFYRWSNWAHWNQIGIHNGWASITEILRSHRRCSFRKGHTLLCMFHKVEHNSDDRLATHKQNHPIPHCKYIPWVDHSTLQCILVEFGIGCNFPPSNLCDTCILLARHRNLDQDHIPPCKWLKPKCFV